MNYELKTTNYKLQGFSLAETLIALGILAVGMMFIAGVFPVAIQLTMVSAERTIAAVVAEEAFAKIRLYGSQDVNGIHLLSDNQLNDFNDHTIFPAVKDVGEYEFTYPSNSFNTVQKQYCWSALCRETSGDGSPVQVTVFVCRKAGRSLKFHKDGGGTCDWPEPCKISVKGLTNSRLKIDTGGPTKMFHTYVSDGCTIVDDDSGQMYHVMRRLLPPNDDIVQLDRAWQGGSEAWVVPPAIIGGRPAGRNPCIAVYQKEIRF